MSAMKRIKRFYSDWSPIIAICAGILLLFYTVDKASAFDDRLSKAEEMQMEVKILNAKVDTIMSFFGIPKQERKE